MSSKEVQLKCIECCSSLGNQSEQEEEDEEEEREQEKEKITSVVHSGAVL